MKRLLINFLAATIFLCATLFYFNSPLHGKDFRENAEGIKVLKIPHGQNSDSVADFSEIKFKRLIYGQEVDFFSRVFLLFNVNWGFLRNGPCSLWALQKLTGHDVRDIVNGLEAARIKLGLADKYSLARASGTATGMSTDYLVAHGYEHADMSFLTPDLPESLEELISRFGNSWVGIRGYGGEAHAFSVVDGVIYDHSSYFVENIGFPGDLISKNYFIDVVVYKN